MIWSVVFVETLLFTSMFTSTVLLPAIRRPETGVHNFPPEIQEEYFETHRQVSAMPRTRRTAAEKTLYLLISTALLAGGAIVAGAQSFRDGVLFAAILYLAVAAWDTFFIDRVLFAHLKMLRLPGTEHMDRAYAQKWSRVKEKLLPGAVVLAVVCVITGLLVTWIKSF